MVAKITFPKRVEAALNYNENKVDKGKAACLSASGYLREPGELTFYQKLEGLERFNSLNDRATTKTLHVSLNFDTSEKLIDERLLQIASCYMEKIGFGEQPYLVYRHQDAGHPHIHIVSTTIKHDGSRINTHNIGRNASEKARKEIELRFGLKRAEALQQKSEATLKPAAVEKAVYGNTETKRAIAGIVMAVFQSYRFNSLAEYNAALRQFNVVADRGKEGGRIYRNGGLVYRLLDESGNKVGVPIKASSIPCSPTLKTLEQKFSQNEPLKWSAKLRLKTLLDDSLLTAGSLTQFSERLAAQNVYLLPPQNGDGKVYGITFVDNRTKCVFNGSDIGTAYSAAALQSRLSKTEAIPAKKTPANEKDFSQWQGAGVRKQLLTGRNEGLSRDIEKTLNQLLSSKEQYDSVSGSLLPKKRKKKKGRNPNSSL
ncbi:relaxase/mobilization nuclease domain-containing protein [Flavisolibacter nicotianae]|uniref:relaxase/mobilization nuclease domain-containing protein n=1 Tax=Flavisolibacter nicotianae TaxID=2364882 RepID=UPI000EB5A67E|nr:relaxase/mobilization nuclease domain-containing protein [Flavisolibacter nicotianae]